jgi:hypothetical protein
MAREELLTTYMQPLNGRTLNASRYRGATRMDKIVTTRGLDERRMALLSANSPAKNRQNPLHEIPPFRERRASHADQSRDFAGIVAALAWLTAPALASPEGRTGAQRVRAKRGPMTGSGVIPRLWVRPGRRITLSLIGTA